MIAKFNKCVIGVPDKGERESLGRINPWRNACQNFPQLTKDMKPWIQKVLWSPKEQIKYIQTKWYPSI